MLSPSSQIHIMLYTRNQLIALFKENNLAQPKAKYSNNVIIQMLERLPQEFSADVEPTRNGFINRGSLVECIIKAVVYGINETSKSNCRVSDLDTTNLNAQQLALVNGVHSKNIEIKFSTSFAPATHKTSKARKTIIVSETMIVMLDSKNIIPTKAGKININNQIASQCETLNNLMDLLGY